MGERFFKQDDVKLTTQQALYCQHISKSGTKAISCVCKNYSSKSTLNSQTITQIYDQWSVYNRYSNFRQFHEEVKKNTHFLVGPGGNCCMPATEFLSFKVPSTSCKETLHHYLPHLDFIHMVGVPATPLQEVSTLMELTARWDQRDLWSLIITKSIRSSPGFCFLYIKQILN